MSSYTNRQTVYAFVRSMYYYNTPSYEFTCTFEQVNSLDCWEFSKVSNIIAFRAYQPYVGFQTIPDLANTTPTAFAMYGTSDQQLQMNDSDFVKVDTLALSTTMATGLTSNILALTAALMLMVGSIF